jgi:geranylgeranyl diphosphate synthase type II
MLSFQDRYAACKEKVDEFLTRHWSLREGPRSEAIQKLKNSIEYSCLHGGKRFRPVLSLFVSDSFAVGPERVLPFAAAVEMIHTYSLVHDDLPCMDNDDIRRGEPTNHKVFGESTALLAGDALLTEAFQVISEAYSKEPALGLALVSLLSEAAGYSGMIAGQTMDLLSKDKNPSLQELNLMHALKTVALIRVSVEGVARILGLPRETQLLCREYAMKLGLAFQLKDDLIDSESKVEPGSFPAILGFQETAEYLKEVSVEAGKILECMDILAGPLHEILEMNLNRKY